MAKFKIGDLVRCTKSHFAWLTKGKCYRVAEPWFDGIRVRDNREVMGCYFESRFERVNEMAEKETIEAQIKQNQTDQEKLYVEGGMLRRELAKLEVTYSVGDRFKHDGAKYILSVISSGSAQLTSLRTGYRWTPPGKVCDIKRITAAELAVISDGDYFVRYFDFQKKEYHGGL